MLLTIGQRFAILGVFPEQGNLLTARTIKSLRKMLDLSNNEIAKYNVKQDPNVPGRISWSREVGYIQKEFELNEAERGLVKKSFVEAEQQGKVSPENIDIFAYFVEGVELPAIAKPETPDNQPEANREEAVKE